VTDVRFDVDVAYASGLYAYAACAGVMFVLYAFL
jgi:hypothetical protein